ncbi:unnamed protein product [Mytilus edulis]|uniref:Uncharacterized protein n=1 Tax=Mytilus edulis TaxID=6550 RepID=A0A8S3V9M3_MYTED|nr:unnamed protein product [Mytilus edulis]
METTTSTMPTKPTDRSNCLHFACSCCCCPCAIDNHTFETDYNKDKPDGYIYNQVCCKRTKQNVTNDDDDWVYGYTNQSLCQINVTIDADLDLWKYGYISAKNCSSFSCISCCNNGTNSYEMNSTFDSSCLFCSKVCNCCGYSNSTDDKMVSVNWLHGCCSSCCFHCNVENSTNMSSTDDDWIYSNNSGHECFNPCNMTTQATNTILISIVHAVYGFAATNVKMKQSLLIHQQLIKLLQFNQRQTS